MNIQPRLPRETAREYALRNIKHNIITLALEPGCLVSENELSAALGVSRTPIREVLSELSKASLIEVLPQKGSRVALIDYELVEESQFLRSVLERAIVALACQGADALDFRAVAENVKLQRFYLENHAPERLIELDDAFHGALFALCGKSRTYELQRGITTHFDRVRRMSLQSVADTHIVEDHEALLTAIRRGDTAAAQDVLTQHLSRFRIDEAPLRETYPNYFNQTSGR
ncbi:MAG: GntR family transcriptional regulator [Oscillospiraceae bacterium]|jgi:DNA-binding GntR family transcriptional regulator|nr:GntR family transcriptional regulator [Oscillospiraceae bacterium]